MKYLQYVRHDKLLSIYNIPLKNHANFSFLFNFWAKVSLEKEEKNNYNCS